MIKDLVNICIKQSENHSLHILLNKQYNMAMDEDAVL